jgi:serine/threonine protein kinase/formylglycine-generating enzyme required for sulfatase activity
MLFHDRQRRQGRMNDPMQTVDEPERQPDVPIPVESMPQHIGRYRVERVLGQGGFGLVYLAHDDQLQRPVAAKVPHRRLVSRPEEAEAYLTEARTVAKLDHPHIVPVYDVGGDEEHPFFIVGKYIEGITLAKRMKDSRPSVAEAVELTATVAETLHYSHKQGIIHRDIKPSNILLDRAGKPFVADFGLALREQDVGAGPRYAGTPAYMSPEQARGEGHRVDGRSDLFSLGIVLYEILTGRRPFCGQTRDEILEQIATLEVRPLRQWDDSIPKELERICLKALSKRAADRYLTAKDMADDLRSFLEESTDEGKSVRRSSVAPAGTVAPGQITTTDTSPLPTPASDSEKLKIVPKGLRSFDAGDADFFLELLPGPRDRGGLPDSIRFWKTRIETTDADNTFSVGLIYGPSGCGKSSLVKAGLLPRLSDGVIALYVAATAAETEGRLLSGLRKRCPALPGNLGLKETLASLRRGQGLPVGKKVLIVLDQFEQWLHARKEEENTELVQALRQCDGGRVQCVVLVRDDFWLAVSRFLKALEVELLEGHNLALVDLFDPLHARKVLAAFGRAYGRLPDNRCQSSKDQNAFLDQAVAGLAQDGKIISVRLALFVEMMKKKLWIPATLKEVGGMEGVGVTFLEETFTASTAPPQHRLHQKAAQAVLKALLPEAGTDIKGHMRSQEELSEASGYASRPREFGDLLRILDSEIRLITPTDPEGKDDADEHTAQAGAKYYQLTHDYLVHSLRAWLTRKQKETRRGRAELLLADRAAVWNTRPENRQLPSLLQWLQIRWLTARKNWTPPERRMMRRAGRVHTSRGIVALLLFGFVSFGGWWTFGALETRARVGNLLTAKTADVPEIIRGLKPYQRWAVPLLRERAAQAGLDEGKRQRVALALLPVDAGQTAYLCEALLAAGGPEEVRAIRAVLHEHAPDAFVRFWLVLTNDKAERSRRLRAASALALSHADDRRWDQVADDLMRCLAGENILLRGWGELLEPVRAQLVPHATRRLAEADAGGFAAYLAMLRAYPEDAAAALSAQLDRSLPATAEQEHKEALARQQAQAAVALLQLGRSARVWPLFHQPGDPTLRTYLIHRCAALGVDLTILENHLLRGEEKDNSIRQGLLLALGEYSADQRAELVSVRGFDQFRKVYWEDSDPGIHSAAEWLLRRWLPGYTLRNQELTKASRKRQPGEITKPRWVVNGLGQTFAVIPAPGKFKVGSPPDEKGRESYEVRREVRIDYAFAMATKLVTVAEFKKCLPKSGPDERLSSGEDTPINAVSWYRAARYCNWLSEQEKIPRDQWCYEPNAKGEYAEGMKVKPNYRSLSGYRLPTEVEWEYACRAGTLTAWAHGSDAKMLGHYAWYLLNSNSMMHPVGSLKPNALGLFDMQGNAWQWCQNVDREELRAGAVPSIIPEINKDIEDVKDTNIRVKRGGSCYLDAVYVRPASRNGGDPPGMDSGTGFRVARTYH